MKKFVLALVLALSAPFLRAEEFSPDIFDDGGFLRLVRRDHPRLFLTREDIPRLREMAKTRYPAYFAKVKRSVDALPPDAPVEMVKSLYTELPDGTIRTKNPGEHGHKLFRYNGAYQANRAALVYLVTGDKKYLELAKRYLKLYSYVLQWTGETAKRWVDWDGVTRINALVAYDWIAADLTPEERRELLTPILEYLKKSAPGGVYKFRRTTGGIESGWYGELAMQWFAGLAAHGDGVDDAAAEKMLRTTAPMYRQMMDFRDRISGGSGLLVAPTGTYTFGPYPHASFFFLHTCRSALGLADAAMHWRHMCDFPRWFDWAKIRLIPETRRILSHGLGDAVHADNTVPVGEMYSHMMQNIHFYGGDPERSRASYALLSQLPESCRVMPEYFAFLPFVLFGFDPAKVPAEPVRAETGRYFHNAPFGLLIVRSGTGEGDTYAAFRFGSQNWRHQHYDELSFIIYKRGFLAIDSGSRTSTAHHFAYAPQTVAHNSLLIHMPEEPLPHFWKPWGFAKTNETIYAHGGQESAVKGRALALQSRPGLVYAAGDATKCYSDKKCRLAVRQWVWLEPDIFVIRDRVESVRPEQKKEFLLHFLNRPEKMPDGTWRADAGQGRLFARTLLPENASCATVGGEGREFFASGRNWPLPGGRNWEKNYGLAGKWRLEVAPGDTAAKTTFLHVLEAADTSTASMIPVQLERTGKADVVTLTDRKGNAWRLEFGRDADTLRVRRTATDGKVVYDEALPAAVEKLRP